MKSARELKKELQAAGIPTKGISIRCDSSINVKIKDLTVDVDKVKEVLAPYESVRRCDYTGEILQGGNTFLFVSYDWEVIRDASEGPNMVAFLEAFVKIYCGAGMHTSQAARAFAERNQLESACKSALETIARRHYQNHAQAYELSY